MTNQSSTDSVTERAGGLPKAVIRLIGDLRASLLTLVESRHGLNQEADEHIETLRADLARLDPNVPLSPRIRRLASLTSQSQLDPDQFKTINEDLAEGIFDRLNRLASLYIESYPSKDALVELRARIEEHAADPSGNLYTCLDDLSRAIQVINDLQNEEGQIMSDYVNEVQSRLAEIEKVVVMSCTASSEVDEAATNEHSSRLKDLKSIQQSVKKSNSLESLRNSMIESISTLTERMHLFHSEQKQRQQHAMNEVKRARGELNAVRLELAVKGRELSTDVLTGLPNRSAFQEKFTTVYNIWRENPIINRTSIMIIDVDYFKAVNDQFGHSEGDHVLCKVAKTLAESMEDNFIARWGGEEFAVICPNTTGVDATQLAARLRNSLATMNITSARGKPITVTASFGIAEIASGQTMEDCFRRADDALYLVKNGGRDGIACHHLGGSKPILILTGRRPTPSMADEGNAAHNNLKTDISNT